MVLAQRLGAHRVLSLVVSAAIAGSVSAAAAGSAHAVETYPRPLTATMSISGHGYGNGDGMSQWGAYGAATHGLSWQQILAFYYPGTALASRGNPTIRVRLDAVGSGVLTVFNTAGLRLAGQPLGSAGVTAYRARSLTNARVQIDKLSAAGWSSDTSVASPAVFSSSSGLVDVKLADGSRRTYRGAINADWASPSAVTAVSALPMESYLRAVVPAEMPASWSPNALRAQAVAARSYASYEMSQAPAGSPWDICDTTSCQMYSGVGAEYPSSDSAVAATADQSLTYAGSPAFTPYGAANGGWTVAGSQPYLPARADPYDGAIPNGANSWTANISEAAIEARWPSIGTYRQLRILRRDGHGAWGGRVLSAAIDGSSGSVAVSGQAISAAFGLGSTWFVPGDGATHDPFGSIDAVSPGAVRVTASGWAIDPDTKAPITVQMYVDGRSNALTWANVSRPDVGAVYPAYGPGHGYDLSMPASPGAHTVCLYGINTGPGASVQLGCRLVTVSSNPFGVIDAMAPGPGRVTASGWAIDPDTKAPIIVQMYVDGRSNALTWANVSRPDVGAVYPAYGPGHGYDLSMPASPGAHTVCLYGINTGPGASVRFGCRALRVP